MRIFLTGASGLIGGEVAALLVGLGHRVTALLRKGKSVLANDGTPVAGIERLSGDVALPRLGLSPDLFQAVAENHDLILNCAATTRFDLDEGAYDAVNVGGTRQVIELARAESLPLLHVSTAYVCGSGHGRIAEDEPLPTEGWTNGYERSKAQGERLVMESGLPCAVARPSIVVGCAERGRLRKLGPAYAMFKMVLEGRLSRLPVSPGASLALVPIDYVANGIVAIAQRMDLASGAYHLVPRRPVTVERAIQAISDFGHFHAPELIDPDRFDPSLLSWRERWIFRNALSHYSGYLTRDPHFDDSRFRQLTGATSPPCDEEFLLTLLRYAIEIGYVKKRR